MFFISHDKRQSISHSISVYSQLKSIFLLKEIETIIARYLPAYDKLDVRCERPNGTDYFRTYQ